MYHSGFLIDYWIFTIGGLSQNGKVIDCFQQINLKTLKY